MAFIVVYFWPLFAFALAAGVFVACRPVPEEKGASEKGVASKLIDLATKLADLPSWLAPGASILANPSAWIAGLLLFATAAALGSLFPGRSGLWLETALVAALAYGAGLSVAAMVRGVPITKTRSWWGGVLAVAATWLVACGVLTSPVENSIHMRADSVAKDAGFDASTVSVAGRDIRLAGQAGETVIAALTNVDGARRVIGPDGRVATAAKGVPASSDAKTAIAVATTQAKGALAAVQAGASGPLSASPRASAALGAAVDHADPSLDAAAAKANRAVDAATFAATAPAGTVAVAAGVAAADTASHAVDIASDKAKAAIDLARKGATALSSDAIDTRAANASADQAKAIVDAATDRSKAVVASAKEKIAGLAGQQTPPDTGKTSVAATIVAPPSTAPVAAPPPGGAVPADPSAPARASGGIVTSAEAATVAGKPDATPDPNAACAQALRSLSGTDDIMFGRKSATLSASVRTILDRVAGAIGVCKHVEIAGHADGRGSPEINQRLSDDRARAVRDYLVGRGVPSAALTPVGYGATQPIAPNDHSRDRARNRRASLVAK